jgi:aminocarboxymuconate-semialdehyde decarboxylase
VPVIDLHSHFFPEAWPDFAPRGGDWPTLVHRGEGRASVRLGGRPFREIDRRCWDADARLADMDRDGVDLQVISATPVLFAYGRDAAAAHDFAQFMNDAALALAARGRGRLRALAQVPLQDTARACRELERALASGHVGVQIGSHVGERELDDDGIVEFLQHCAALDCPVLVHPWDMLAPERTRRWMAAWTVGMPAETQAAIVAMILGGAFDRLPRSLRICFAHGGGSFAFLLGRLENAWLNREVVRGRSAMPPSRYLDRFVVDSAVFDARALRLLVETMGATRVALGSDYPFPLGEARVGALVRGADGIGDDARRAILGASAAAFLGKRLG